MTRSSRWMGLGLAACAIAAVAAAPTTCGDMVRVFVQLERAPTESSARGEIRLQMNGQRSTLRLRVRGLDPGSEYLVLADGVEQARFTTGSAGDASLTLQYPPSSGTELLDFDPRGKLVSVSDGSQDRLSAVVSGPLEPERIQVLEVAGIPPIGPAWSGTAQGLYQTLPLGCRIFKLRLHGMAPGSYQVRIDGALVGEVEADAAGAASLHFWSTSSRGGYCPQSWTTDIGPPDSPSRVRTALDFEPRGAQVEVIRDGETVFAGPMRAEVALPDEALGCPPLDIQLELTPLWWFASGDASLQSGDGDCNREFTVTARGVPVANYELWVAGEVVGTVPVRNWPGGPSGTVRFATYPDDPGELPLEFDPRGRFIEVRRPVSTTTVPYLEGSFPTE